MEKLIEEVKFVNAVNSADIDTADVTSTYVDAKDFKQITGSAQCEALTVGKILTVQLLQATDSSGTGAKVLGTAVTYTAPTGGGRGVVQQHAYTAELDNENGFRYVAVRVGTDLGSAVVGSAQILLSEPSYKPVSNG